MLRWLNAREWLEHERLAGLPTADLAGEALGMLDELAGYQDQDEPGAQAVSDMEDVEKHVAEFAGKGTIVERTEAADLRWWAVWDVLVEAGVVERNQSPGDVDVPALLRMFLPAE